MASLPEFTGVPRSRSVVQRHETEFQHEIGTGASLLDKLPPELRNRIFAATMCATSQAGTLHLRKLEEAADDERAPPKVQREVVDSGNARKLGPVSLLLVCKQITAEVLPVVVYNHRIHLANPLTVGCMLSSDMVVSIRQLTIQLPKPEFYPDDGYQLNKGACMVPRHVTQIPNLEHLEVQISSEGCSDWDSMHQYYGSVAAAVEHMVKRACKAAMNGDDHGTLAKLESVTFRDLALPLKSNGEGDRRHKLPGRLEKQLESLTHRDIFGGFLAINNDGVCVLDRW